MTNILGHCLPGWNSVFVWLTMTRFGFFFLIDGFVGKCLIWSTVISWVDWKVRNWNIAGFNFKQTWKNRFVTISPWTSHIKLVWSSTDPYRTRLIVHIVISKYFFQFFLLFINILIVNESYRIRNTEIRNWTFNHETLMKLTWFWAAGLLHSLILKCTV